MKRGIALAGGCRGGMDPGPAQPPGAAPRDVHGLAAGRTARRRMGIHRRTTKALWPVGQDGGRCAIDARQAHCQLPGEGGKEGPGTGEGQAHPGIAVLPGLGESGPLSGQNPVGKKVLPRTVRGRLFPSARRPHVGRKPCHPPATYRQRQQQGNSSRAWQAHRRPPLLRNSNQPAGRNGPRLT